MKKASEVLYERKIERAVIFSFLFPFSASDRKKRLTAPSFFLARRGDRKEKEKARRISFYISFLSPLRIFFVLGGYD